MKRTAAFLIALFPRAFREEFGARMAEDIARDHARARQQGFLAASGFRISTTIDLLRSAVAERINPTWVAPHRPAQPEMVMTLDEWMKDLRHAARALRRAPGFTTVAVLTLGLAIGANAGMFGVVNAVLLNPLPFKDADRLVYIAASAPGSDLPAEFGVANEFYLQYKEQSKLLEDVTVFGSFTSTLRTEDRVERIRMGSGTISMYTTLGARPILGRLPVPEDEDDVVVISHALWQSWFGGDSSVIGKTYDISYARRTIVGIMGPGFRFPTDDTMLWMSGEVRADNLVPGRFGAGMVARMAPGVSLEGLASELNVLASRLPARFGGSANYAKIMEQHRAVVRPLEDQVLGAVSRPLWVMLGAVGFVLLIACANVANLFAVRAEGRQRELAVRRAIGAARTQLVGLQVAESVVVAGLAALLAVFLAYVTLPAFARVAPAGIPRIGDVSLDATTIGYTVLAAIVAALLCGLAPAVRASAPDLTKLREGGRGATRGAKWARNALVAGQSALALVMLIGSGLLVRSFWELRSVDPGYDTTDVFTFQFAPEQPALNDGPTWAAFHLDAMNRLRAIPGVQQVGLVENVPLNEGTALAPFRTEASALEADGGKRLRYTFAAGDYYRVMGIKLLSGRAFEDADHTTTPGNVVISRSAAEALWPGEDAVGRRLQRVGDSTWNTVVGVVADVIQNDFRNEPDATVYLPLVGPTPNAWAIGTPAYVLKTPRAETIAPDVRAILKDIAPEAPMYRVFTMDRLVADSMVALSFTMLTLGILSGLALLLGAVGLYGVLSYVVAERTREIGVRMALGARTDQVRRMVVVQGARVVGAGVVIGVIVALASTKALGTLLYGVAALDLTTFLAMSGSMLLVGLVASYLPARRASNVDPIESLRSE